ncbi:MAG: RecB-like helicase [Arcobacter sp.]|nr:RecB-like helicase [Arcobacter sp.]
MKKYLALKASAGSGKTFALAVRYISLLIKGAKPSEILTLTFTNKAANEMSERIYKTLLTLGDDKAYLDAICSSCGLEEKEVLGAKNSLIKSFSNTSLAIFTIDKFVNKILREFCGYIGISDDFEIKQDDMELLSMKFLQSLNSSQFETLIDFSLYEKKKFNSLIDLFKILIEKNEKVDIVNIDATLINLQKQRVLEEAFKIKEFILSCEVASNAVKKAVDFENFDELFSKTWLEKTSLKEHNYFKKCANDTLDEYFFELKNQMGIYYNIRAGYSLNKLFELFMIFKEFKNFFNKTKNYLEFCDVSNFVYDLLSSQKIDRDFLYFRLDSVYSHILIDEFQDTSLLQYKILEPLIQEILSGESEKFKTFFYVGDTKQSIYRFRGGKKELFDYVANTNDLMEVEILNTNYRSKEKIVSFVNSIFSPLANYEYYEQKSIKEGGFVEVCEDKALEQDDKFVNVASKIASLLQNGVNFNDIAILTYTNDDVLNLYYYLKDKFPQLKISTEMTSKLINQKNVKAVINAIKYLYFKEDLYKENLNALIGKDLQSPFDFHINLRENTVPFIVKQLGQNLKIIDDNVVRFIEICQKFKNIVDFIYEVDKLEEIMPNYQTSGLQILTIFKSKGLEFHTVILLDRIKRKVADKSSLLFDYENIALKNIFYKIKAYENYNEDYKKALEKEKSLSLQDEINILYVALTRARANMIIFKKEKSSVFDILNIKSLCEGVIEESSSTLNAYDKKEKIQYIPLSLGVQEKQIIRDKDEESLRLYARYFGIATHYCLEMMNEFSKEECDKNILLAKSLYANYLSSKDFEDIKNRIYFLIENKTFQELVKDASFISEQSLLYKGELKIIDLLLYKDGKYYIFDYKTTKEKSYKHKEQVLFYKKAIKEIFKSDEVFSYLIYLKEDGVILDEVK